MTHSINLEVTEQELVAILYALQDRSNEILNRIRSNGLHANLSENKRMDIATILDRQFKETTQALAQVEKTIESSYNYN